MFDYNFFWKEESFENLNEELKNLKKNNELLENSFNFLDKKLNEFNNNQKLEDFEIKIIKSQINFHKILKINYDNYIKYKWKITKNTNKILEELYHTNSNQSIADDELNEIEWITKREWKILEDTYVKDTPRDIIEDNIEIIWWQQWFTENEETSFLLDQLTISYLDLFWTIKIDNKNWFKLNDKEILLIWRDIVNKLMKLEFNFYPNLILKLNWKLKQINLLEIKEQIEKEQSDIYKIELFNKLLNNTLNNYDYVFIKKYTWQDFSSTIFEKEIDKICIFWDFLLKEWLIWKNDILINIEKKDDFIYNDFLKKYWLPKNLEKIFKNLVEKLLTWTTVQIEWKKTIFTEKFIKGNFEDFKNKINNFIQFLLDIESDWWKPYARNPKSTAKKSFQFIDWYKKNENQLQIIEKKFFIELNQMQNIHLLKLL
jgi:hypothetical protein